MKQVTEIQALRQLATELELLENLKRVQQTQPSTLNASAITDQYERIAQARAALSKVKP